MSTMIEVVWVDLDALNTRNLAMLTTSSEREHAAKRQNETAGLRYLARRAAMRQIIGNQLGVAPVEVGLSNDAYGRPIVSGGAIHISQSARGSLMIAALCADRAVGCDIEEMRADIDVDGVAELCFGPTERRRLDAMMPEQKLHAFYDCWTRKEAYLKATGTGLMVEMASLETTHCSGPPTPMGRVDWTSESWTPLPGFIAAVVARGEDWRFRCQAFDARLGALVAA